MLRGSQKIICNQTNDNTMTQKHQSPDGIITIKRRRRHTAAFAELEAISVPQPIRSRIFACQTEDDWDDEGATGITMQACKAAVCFLKTLLEWDSTAPIPQIFPIRTR